MPANNFQLCGGFLPFNSIVIVCFGLPLPSGLAAIFILAAMMDLNYLLILSKVLASLAICLFLKVILFFF